MVEDTAEAIIDSIWLPRRQKGIRGIQRIGGKIGLGNKRMLPSLEPELMNELYCKQICRLGEETEGVSIGKLL